MEDNAHDWREVRGRHRASPLVRRIAEERGLDLSAVEGSGPGGRIVERDLDGIGAGAEAGPAGAGPEARRLPRERNAESGAEPRSAAGSKGTEAVPETPARGREVITLRQRVAIGRLALLQEVIGESHGAVPLWAFVARALLRLGHGPVAVAEGFAPPRRLGARAADPVTALAGRVGDAGAAPCALVDLGGEGLAGGDLPLPDGTELQVVLGTPQGRGAEAWAEISLTVLPDAYGPAEAASLLKSLAGALERPGALLSNLPDV